MAADPVQERHGMVSRHSLRSAATLIVGLLFVLLFAGGLFSISQDGHPLSIIDEHIHFDTAAAATQGEIPYRGTIIGDALIQEWACGVGHEAGPTTVPCGDPSLDASSIPSGKYSSGYIHYPTFFFLAAGFQDLWSAATGSDDLLSAFRAFSALTMTLGVIVVAIFAWGLGLRGSRLLAAMSIPVASSMIVVSGINVNPTSAAVVTGALVAGTGLLWVRRNRGFIWFALALATASSVAVTSSLPAGGFLIAMLFVLIGRRFWPNIAPGWTPRWWEFAVSSVLVLIPVIVWGRVISARATIENDVLYGYLPITGKKDIVVGSVRELLTLHTPWRETMGIKAAPDAFVARIAHAISEGAPTWITAIMFGALAATLFVLWERGRKQNEPLLNSRLGTRDGGPPNGLAQISATHLVALGTLATIILYPPALRISNWLNFGFDFPIVERYSSAFGPILILVVLLCLKNRALSRTLAIIGILTALGTVSGAL